MMPIQSGSLRDTLRLWGSGVCVVTSVHDDDSGHHRTGMTVSAFNSLSLEPPMVLVCLNKDTHTTQMIEQSNVFAVSILADSQAHLSDRFAGRVPLPNNEDRFEGVPILTADTGSPILTDALAWMDCRVQQRHDGGTHWIVLGEVLATGQRVGMATAAPLIYYNRGYHTLPVNE
ncbi:MAG: flavin reductase family protein [Chloroflexota bacterium]|nr:flavin reductase family protein [Chloroflexota bacterium]